MRAIWILLIVAFHPVNCFGLPAYPGAMGMGADTVHGRGGTVYVVDTLLDVVDPGDNLTSLREAVEASGPRVVVFSISGNIVLQDVLTISNPYLYIAGQSSPGGIAIAGERTRIITTHDILIRHVRFRVGYSQANPPNDDADMENLQVWGSPSQNNSMDTSNHSYNVVIDHCSFAFAIDEGLETAYTVYDITFSYNLVGKQWKNPANVNGQAAEGRHDLGQLLWGKYTAVTPRITMLGNVYISNTARQPQMNYNGFVDLQNNISYDTYGGNTPGFHSESETDQVYGNFINNYTLAGPQSNTRYGTLTGNDLNQDGSMYTSGNTGCNIPEGDADWCVGNGWQQYLLDPAKRATTPFPTTGIPVITSPIRTKSQAFELVKYAGATSPVRDRVDQELVDCFEQNTNCTQNGAVPFPSGWPTYSQDQDNPTDSDKDGIVDSWELSRQGDLSLTPAGFDLDKSYTNIEIYLSEIIGDVSHEPVVAPAGLELVKP